MEPINIIAYLLMRCAEKSQEIASLTQRISELEQQPSVCVSCQQKQMDKSWQVSLSPETWN